MRLLRLPVPMQALRRNSQNVACFLHCFSCCSSPAEVSHRFQGQKVLVIPKQERGATFGKYLNSCASLRKHLDFVSNLAQNTANGMIKARCVICVYAPSKINLCVMFRKHLYLLRIRQGHCLQDISSVFFGFLSSYVPPLLVPMEEHIFVSQRSTSFERSETLRRQ